MSAIPVRSSCSIYQRTPVIPVRSQQHTGVSVTIHLSSRQSFSPRWSMWSLYTSVFLSHTLRRQNHQKSFRLRQLCGQNDEGTQERISAVLLRDDKNNHSSNIIAGNRAESGTTDSRTKQGFQCSFKKCFIVLNDYFGLWGFRIFIHI